MEHFTCFGLLATCPFRSLTSLLIPTIQIILSIFNDDQHCAKDQSNPVSPSLYWFNQQWPPPPAWATLVCFRSSKYNAPAKGNPNGYEMIEWRVSLNNRNDIISPKFVRCPLNYCCRCERSLSNCISASSAFIKLTSSGFKSSRGRWTIFSRASNIVALTSFVRHPTFFFRWT